MSRTGRMSAPGFGGTLPTPARATEVTALIDGYLVNLASALPCPRSTSSAIVSEIEDGLMEAVSDYKARGMRDKEAAQAAIGEFGEPAAVAEAFRPEFIAKRARSTAIALIASGPLVGAAWIAGAFFAGLPPVRDHLSGPWLALPLVGLAIVIAAPSSVIALVTTGRAGLRLPMPPSLPSKAVSVASIAALAADSTLLLMLVFYALTTPASRSFLPLAPAIAISLVRAFFAVRHRLHTRRSGRLAVGSR
ncbi:MAG TPA: permease prefix domain 1-containing protein [Streptosporangiaceae bacterium]